MKPVEICGSILIAKEIIIVVVGVIVITSSTIKQTIRYMEYAIVVKQISTKLKKNT
jgi:hypothetical protein